MNNFIDVLFKTIAITFLLVLTLFLFSLLIEYVRFLWARHKINKNMKKLNKTIDEVIKNNKGELNEEELQNTLQSLFKQDGNDNVKVDGVKVIKIDREKENKE